MNKPILSKNFTVDDIRKLRDYNGERHFEMSDEDLIRETEKNAEELLNYLEQRKSLTVG